MPNVLDKTGRAPKYSLWNWSSGWRARWQGGIDTRTVLCVTETKGKQDDHLSQYLGCILLCNQSHMQDTHKRKPTERITLLHKVSSTATVSLAFQQPVYTVKVGTLTCNCLYCIIADINDKCIYLPWLNARMKDMIEAVEGGDQTESSS